MPDVVVVGAGIIGAACAYFLTEAGAEVTVLERATVAGGTSSRGEGNLLVSDKGPGPELALALRSLELWNGLGERLGAERIELQAKGGIVLSRSDSGYRAMLAHAAAQRDVGVRAEPLDAAGLREHEPHLSGRFTHGMHYPQDMQLQPALATTALLAAAGGRGASIRRGVSFHGVVCSPDTGRVTSVSTSAGQIRTDAVVNAAGTASPDVAGACGTSVPVTPRRGFVLVTEALPPLVRHKVFTGEYLQDVGSDTARLVTSPVVEGTPSGPVLIGASREQVGHDTTMSLDAVQQLARNAIELFPALAGVRAIRTYHGFRPYSPDHLPLIGPDARVPGLFHATGHEGAGIGLAPATGELVAALICGTPSPVDHLPFAPSRFAPSGFAAAQPAGRTS